MTKSKNFSSTSDLAINGAEPAFSQPIHVGRPNIGSKEKFLMLAGQVIDSKWLTNNGPLVEQLEQKIAQMLGVKHCICICNATVALEIAVRAAGLKGEVIVPSYTFIATAHALSWQGITPVFADIDQATHNLDPEAVRKMITPRTTGILATHLWGNPCNVKVLEEIAEEHGLRLVFDAAHAFLAGHNERMIGNYGVAEVFSFHATKFFNTFEGGAITTNDDKIANQIRLMRNFGFNGVDNVIHPGTNGKMTEICAAMGLVNLEHIDEVLSANKRNYKAYCSALNSIDGLTVLPISKSGLRNYQYVVLEVSPDFGASRNDLVAALQAENILARKYFWPGCHNMKPYRELYPHAGMVLPNTQVVSDRVIVLPTGTTLPKNTIDVVGAVCKLLGR